MSISTNNKFEWTPKQKSFWFKLLIDDKNELNVFQIKKNKKIYLITNFIVFIIYLIPFLIFICEIIIRGINLDENDKLITYLVFLGINILFLILSLICCGYSFYLPLYQNCAYLIHSRYLIDKFLYFYNINFSENINEILNKKNKNDPLYTIKYLKVKDKSKLELINHFKHSGKINKLYLQDKNKAKKLMSFNINYFYYLTDNATFYIVVLILLFFCIWLWF